MFTLYLDHNIVHYFVKGFPASVPEAGQRQALAQLLGRKDCRFVVSDWNCLEPCRENDAQAGKKGLVRRYADFLLSLNPLYLPTVTAIKRAEMEQLVLGKLGLQYRAAAEIVFNKTFSQARAASGIDGILLGYSIADFMMYLVNHPSELAQYESAEAAVLDAQKTMRRAKVMGLDKNKAIVSAIWRQWFDSMMPTLDLERRAISRADRDRLLTRFVADPKLVLRSCPAIHAEDLLSDARASDIGRAFKESDAIDLMHAVPVLAYCDVFVSNDGFVRDCAKRVVRATRRLLGVAKTMSEALEHIDTRTA
jgi:hypothetical protein